MQRCSLRRIRYNVTNTFDSLGHKTTASDANGTWSFYYNNLGLLTAVSNACGLERTTAYDLLDRPVYAADANGVTITNTYDNLDRLTVRGYPDGGLEHFGYSARGLIAYTNQLGSPDFYAYDAADRMTFHTNANHELLQFVNSAAGDLLSLTDAKSQTTQWSYDEYGRVTNKVDQLGTTVFTYTYDPDSRLTNRFAATGSSNTRYQYDPIGNLTNIAYPHSGTVRLQYDALNRLTNMVDSVGTTKYTYTATGQPLTEDGPFASDTVTNTYANRLRVALSLQQPAGLWTNGFAYDSASRLANVISPAGSFTNVYFTGIGGSYSSRLVQKLCLANRSVITNNYDSVARLLATHLRTSTGVLTNKHEYQYDLAGERANQTRIDGINVPYGYDKIGQLKTAIVTGGGASDQWGYNYDSGWNLTQRTNGYPSGTVTTYAYKGADELKIFGSPSYDSNGNLTSYNTTSYTYDDEQRLVHITCTNQFQTGFAYDAFGRLRTRTEYASNGTFVNACNYASIAESVGPI